jgi:hypothetical protein
MSASLMLSWLAPSRRAESRNARTSCLTPGAHRRKRRQVHFQASGYALRGYRLVRQAAAPPAENPKSFAQRTDTTVRRPLTPGAAQSKEQRE